MTSAAMMLAVCTLLFLACRSNAEGDTILPATKTDGGVTESENANATGTMSPGPAINDVKPNSLKHGKCLDKCASDNDTSKGSVDTSGSTKSPTSDGASTTASPKVTSEKSDSTSATGSANATTASTSRAGMNASTVVTPKTAAPANVTIKPAGNASGPSRLAASSDVLCVAVAIGALLWRAT